jgi:hypothetical protein
LRHIVVTRLGIGVSRPSFYEKQLSLMEATMLPSLAAQTRRDFEWAIGVDALIDDASLKRLQEMIAPYPHFRVVKCNPIESLVLHPTLTELLGQDDGGRLLLSRADCDDALGVRFVEIVREHAERFDGLAAFAFQSGTELAVSQGVLGPVTYKSLALGISMLSDGRNRHHIYAGNHTLIGDWIVDLGGTFVPIDLPGCHYLHVRRDDSDSHLNRRLRLRTTDPVAVRDQDGRFGSYYQQVCAAVGIPLTAFDAIRAVTPEAEQRLPFPKLPRIATKKRLLQLLGEARAANSDERTIQALVNAVYSL